MALRDRQTVVRLVSDRPDGEPGLRTWQSKRPLTAISRMSLSMPVRQAIVDQQLLPVRTVLDYGCGRGDDLRSLLRLNYRASGWDPHYRPTTTLDRTDVVLLTYVLNVIEDPVERAQTLLRAWGLTDVVLVVSGRLTWEKARVRGMPIGDGVLTGRETFQHLFQPNELRRYVEERTGVRCVSAAPGVIYAFREDRARLDYLARQILPATDWLGTVDTASAIAATIDHVERRGRLPNAEEMPESVGRFLSHIKRAELCRLVLMSADNRKVANSAKRSTLDALLFLAVELFNGRGPFGSLPKSVQFDVRTFFDSYKEACRRADRLLLKLRDDSYVAAAMRGSHAGKATPTALYVHRRAIDRIPVVLRLYEHCASIAAGRPTSWSVVKLRHKGRAVSWIDCPSFDEVPHPTLESTYEVDLKTLDTSYTSYADHADRPVLHRKHEFLAPEDPLASRYERLTRAELKAGLYDRPHLIGTELGWKAELDRCGRELRGHRLVRRTGH